MLELTLGAAGGLVVGVVITWLLSRAHFTATARTEREPLQIQIATAESMQQEVRRQLAQRERELADLATAVANERTRRAQAETRLEEARASLDEQRRFVEKTRQELSDTFKALSAESLRQSNRDFLALARDTLDAQLAPRQEAIAGLLTPLQEALRRSDDHIRELERAREHAYGSLDRQLHELTERSRGLEAETARLVNALRSPQVRGRWGEITLRRVVELAGMAANCDYVEQLTLESDTGRQRPDMIVRLPAGHEVVVDAKVPLTAYLDALAAPTPEERAAALARHAQQVRTHMLQLAAKAYWEQFPNSPELVVMFVPMESFVAAAAEADAALIEDGMRRRVVIATPTTLIALLRTIAHGWSRQRLAANAERISELGKQLYDRLRSLGEHFEVLGASLGKAVSSYNQAVGSLEARVLPAARKFRDLGTVMTDEKEIGVLEPVDQQPRRLTAPEFPTQLDTSDLPA